ncbi:MAG: DUF4397 domain-containing protein [Bdellovibrionota bacterium]
MNAARPLHAALAANQHTVKRVISLAWLVTFSATLTLLGCAPEDSGSLRVMNLAPDVKALDLFDDGDLLFNSVNYSEVSDYESLSVGPHQLRAAIHDSFTALSDERETIGNGNDYTLFVFGFGADADAILTLDDNSKPDSGRAKLRFVQGSPSSANVDVYISAPNERLVDLIPTFENERFEDVTEYVDSEEGDYRVRITEKGTVKLLADTGAFHLNDGEVSSVVYLDKQGGGAPFGIAIYTDAD